jgi:hypothetical protein
MIGLFQNLLDSIFMLRLYARVLFTESLPALEQIADEISELYKRRNVRYRKKNKKSFYFSTTLTVVESQGILSNILNHHNRPSAFHNFAFSLIVPFFVTFQEERVMKIRTVFSSLIQTLPLTEKLISFLRFLKVPEQFLDPAVVFVYSLYQVQSIRFSHGHKSLNLFEVGRKTFLTAFCHVICRKLTTELHKYVWFIPDWMISTYIAFKTAGFIQRLVRYGVRDSLEWLFEGMLHTFMFLEKKLEDLPPEYSVPSSLTCVICHGIVKDPVECLGHFFCSLCLDEWFSKGNLRHPVTSEIISKEVVAPSLLLHIVAWKYQTSALKLLRL